MDAIGRHVVDLDISGLAVTVSCGHVAIADAVAAHFQPWQVNRASGERGPVYRIDVEAHGGYRLTVPHSGCALSRSEPMPRLLRTLQQSIDEVFVQRASSFSVVHAGVVAVGGRAVILPGPSTSGKTSLVRQLLACGAHYCSDEYALVDAAGLIHPYPRSLMIRDGAQEQVPTPAGHLNARVQSQPALAAVVAFLPYQPGAAWAISPMGPGEALIGLLRNTPQVLAECPSRLSYLSALVSAVRLFEGVRGESADAAPRILELIEG